MTDVSATVMPARQIEQRMKRLRHPEPNLCPRAMLDLELGDPSIHREYHLYPKAVLHLKLDGESNPHS